MISDYEASSSWKYHNLVPRRYWRRTGLDARSFRVLEPWHRPYYLIRQGERPSPRHPLVATCVLRKDGGFVRLAVRGDQQPALYEAVLCVGKLLFSSKRTQKYFNVYRAYEAVCPEPRLEFAVVRHALSHAASALTRPRTVAALRGLFGTTSVDLDDPKHQRVFYQQLSFLMMANDDALADALTESLPNLTILQHAPRLVSEW